MDSRSLDVLEFPKVLDRLAAHASFSLGKARVHALRPTADLVEAERRQTLTQEARRLLDLRPQVTIGGARDVGDLVRRAALGGRLEASDLLEVGSTLEAMRNLRRAVLSVREQIEHVAELANGLADLRSIEDAIARAIDGSGQVVDAASPVLGRLRAEVRTAHSRLIDKLNGILSSPAYADAIQDGIITVRDGRYVIPIKAEARNKLRSIVHDQSSSGATLFVEPLITVELNNRWRELQLAEQHEVERILQELSSRIGREADAILFGLERLADLDFLLAAARYAGALNAVQPRLVEGRAAEPEAELRLINARHPLLAGRVVPTTIRLGGDFSILVITGPNTGGKTVALKTAGLLTLMALAGLQIPADDGSAVRVVDAVHADIGDEQSIEQSLSTFSSHMRQIVNILGQATDRSLVLLDELGAGTDPTEGSALAWAILDELLHRGALTIATTHYSELKAYAHSTPGVANASVEFDVETLSPTYRLAIGPPGRSNALAIASRLGVPQQILDAARSLLSEEEVRVESMLGEIQAERERAERARRAAEKEHRRVADLAKQLSSRLAELERERASAREAVHREAEAELAELRERMRDLARRIERGAVGRETLRPLMDEVKAAERQVAAHRPQPTPKPANAPLQVGSWVRHRKLGQVGQVTALTGDHAEVQVGAFKTRARTADLEPATRSEHDRQERGYDIARPAGPIPQIETDIRGWRADQVAPELDRYLNDAYLAGLPFVRIVHGKGTGVLRQVVREHLANHPLVQSFNPAQQREGGEGVTIASLAS